MKKLLWSGFIFILSITGFASFAGTHSVDIYGTLPLKLPGYPDNGRCFLNKETKYAHFLYCWKKYECADNIERQAKCLKDCSWNINCHGPLEKTIEVDSSIPEYRHENVDK